MGQTAVAHVFAHGDRRVVRVVLSAAEGLQGLTDNDLGRETDVVVDILLSKPDGLPSSDLQGHGLHALPRKRGGHDPAEGVGRVGHQHHFVRLVLLFKFHWIGGLKLPRLQSFLFLSSHGHCLQEGPDADTQGALDVALVQLQDKRDFPGYLVHQPDDLIRQVGVMAAAKAHHLHVLQAVALSRQDGGGEHPCVEVVDNVDPAFTEVHILDTRNRVRCEHGNSRGDKHLRQVVIDKGIVLIGPGRQDNSKLPFLFHSLNDGGSLPFQLCPEALLGLLSRCNSFLCLRLRYLEMLFHIDGKLPVPVLF